MSKQIRIGVIILAVLVAAYMGMDMWELYQNEQLWGYRPVILFIAIWKAIQLSLTLRWKEMMPRWRWLTMSTVSGILLALSFPPFSTTFLIFLAWVPLLLVEHEASGTKNSGRKVMFFAYNTFVIWNILATYWVGNTAFVAGVFAMFLNAFFMSVPFWLFHKTKLIMPRLGYTGFVVYWISFELLHLTWEISWPWITLGNAFSQFPSWVQWYEYTGVFGGSLWALLANLLVFFLVRNFLEKKEKPAVLEIGKVVGLLVIPIAVGLFMYSAQTQKGPKAEVVIVQPNFEPHHEKFTIPDRTQLKRFVALADTAITPKTKYVLFPETSFGLVEISDFDKNGEIRFLKSFLEKHPQVTLITGVDSYKQFAESDPDTRHTRTVKRGSGTMRYELYNGAIQMRAGNYEEDHYKKSRFVPGPEIFPYRDILFFVKPVVDYLGGSVMGLGSQPQRSVFEMDGMKIAPSICYESIYGSYNTGYIKKGAQATFIMTNDGWWDNTAGHRQHLQFATLRSIETRRDIARSANTGISAFINQRGDILQPTKYDEAVAIRGDIQLNDEITFYVIWGDMIARLSFFTALLLVGNLFVKWRVKR